MEKLKKLKKIEFDFFFIFDHISRTTFSIFNHISRTTFQNSGIKKRPEMMHLRPPEKNI